MRRTRTLSTLASLGLAGLFVAAGLLAPPVGTASSHREAPMISEDPLADNTDVYAFRDPITAGGSENIILVANYIPLELPSGGPNYHHFGENIQYEIHVKNQTDEGPLGSAQDDITYRFTFTRTNENPNTFFPILLGAENLNTSYTMEKSTDGGQHVPDRHHERYRLRRQTSGRARSTPPSGLTPATASSPGAPSPAPPRARRSSSDPATTRSSSTSAASSTSATSGRSSATTVQRLLRSRRGRRVQHALDRDSRPDQGPPEGRQATSTRPPTSSTATSSSACGHRPAGPRSGRSQPMARRRPTAATGSRSRVWATPS